MKRPMRTSPRLLSSNELRATTGGGMFTAVVQAVKTIVSGGDGGGGGGGGTPEGGYMTLELENTLVSSV